MVRYLSLAPSALFYLGSICQVSDALYEWGKTMEPLPVFIGHKFHCFRMIFGYENMAEQCCCRKTY